MAVRAWEFEHSIQCDVSPEFAWNFWTEVRHLGIGRRRGINRDRRTVRRRRTRCHEHQVIRPAGVANCASSIRKGRD